MRDSSVQLFGVGKSQTLFLSFQTMRKRPLVDRLPHLRDSRYIAPWNYRTLPVLWKFKKKKTRLLQPKFRLLYANICINNLCRQSFWEARCGWYSHYPRVSEFTSLLIIVRAHKVGMSRRLYWSTFLVLVQYIVCFSHTCRTAAMLLESDQARLTNVCCSIVAYCFKIPFIICCFLLQCFLHLYKQRTLIVHKFSMGFQSEENAGQSSTLKIWCRNQTFVTLALWQDAKPCMNTYQSLRYPLT